MNQIYMPNSCNAFQLQRRNDQVHSQLCNISNTNTRQNNRISAEIDMVCREIDKVGLKKFTLKCFSNKKNDKSLYYLHFYQRLSFDTKLFRFAAIEHPKLICHFFTILFNTLMFTTLMRVTI